MVQDQRADLNEHPTVLQDGLDLGDQRVIHLERLDWLEAVLGEQRPCRRVHVNDVRVVQPASTALRRRALWRELTGIEPGGHDRDRDVHA